MSAYQQFDLSFKEAIKNEFSHGLKALNSETTTGALQFAKGAGRGGDFTQLKANL
jgi:enoyl-CoA hydratase